MLTLKLWQWIKTNILSFCCLVFSYMRSNQSMKHWVCGWNSGVYKRHRREHMKVVSLSGSCSLAEQVIWFLLSNRGCTGICSEHLPRAEALSVNCSSYWLPSPHDKGFFMFSRFHSKVSGRALKNLRNNDILSLFNEIPVNSYLGQPRNKKGDAWGDRA